jgi:hypothetical protein
MHAAQHAGGAGHALKDETRVCGAGPEDQQAITNEGNSAAQPAASQPADPNKDFATAVAEAARLRCALHQLQSGHFLVVRQAWGMSRELGTLDEVRRLLVLMAGGGQ